MGGIENLQQLKHKLISEEKQTRQILVEKQHLIKKELSSKAYTVFLRSAIQQFQDLIEKKKQKGELPSGIKQQFVQQRLCLRWARSLHPKSDGPPASAG